MDRGAWLTTVYGVARVAHDWRLSTQYVSTKSVMLSNHLILCCSLLLLPSIFLSFRVFGLFASSGQSIGALASVLTMNIQD